MLGYILPLPKMTKFTLLQFCIHDDCSIVVYKTVTKINWLLIGVSLSKPHTCELNHDFVLSILCKNNKNTLKVYEQVPMACQRVYANKVGMM